MSIFLGFDFGLRHIGVAVGSDITSTARPLQALKAVNGIPEAAAVEKLMLEYKPEALVVGLPVNMDGSVGPMTPRAKKFGNRLQDKFKIKVTFVDERLTSADAKQYIFEKGGFRALKNHKEQIDCLSAAEILEQYLRDLK